jgi:hypothetical protein
MGGYGMPDDVSRREPETVRAVIHEAGLEGRVAEASVLQLLRARYEVAKAQLVAYAEALAGELRRSPPGRPS